MENKTMPELGIIYYTHNFKFKFWRFSDAITALGHFDCCEGVYVEKATVKECFRKDVTTGFPEKVFLCTVDLRTRHENLLRTGLMKIVKDLAMKD